MSLKTKREYLEGIRGRYGRAGREHKSRIRDEFCANCGYHRKHALRLSGARESKAAGRPGPSPRYGLEVERALKRVWLASDQLCSKRLKAALPLWLEHWPQLAQALRDKLLAVSAATMDRLLVRARVRCGGKKFCGTKPGTLLKHQIPIPTSNWDITRPGFIEADTVAHCGGSLAGDFIWSLTFTDIFSGWTECRAVWNRGASGVKEQIAAIERELPFTVEGFDCDNGSEFLNWPLVEYFRARKSPVGFTRARSYHKNDNAHVEQKNWTQVRQLLGYERLERPELVAVINRLYAREWSWYQNFFCPSSKLVEKKRIKSQYRRRHDNPQTPYQRLLASGRLSQESRACLQERFAPLNPFELKDRIEKKLSRIL